MTGDSKTGRPKRHCWECRRRCLVCDFTEPSCQRCTAASVDCPGYGDVKPTRLRWVATGKVTSRGRRGNAKRSIEDSYKQQRRTTQPEFSAWTIAYTPRFKLNTDICALPQAVEYFNSCILPDLIPLLELGPNPHVYPLTATHIRVAATTPEYLQFGMVCMILSHRLNRTRADSRMSRKLTERFYHYWGLAIRSLNEHLDVKDARTGDLAIAGILTLLLADVQNGTSLDWRCHMEGVHKIISLRGGLHAVAGSRTLEPLLLVLWSVAVIGNTTCPASDLATTAAQLDALDLIMERFTIAVSPFHMFPLPLYGEMIRINHLRARALVESAGALSQEASEILERIQRFSIEEWAESRTPNGSSSQEDWMLLGSIHQSALLIYCILSLQSLSVFPETPSLRETCAAHGQLLHLLLKRALSSPKMRRFTIWPLVLLGVEGVHGGPEARRFVARQLPELSRDLGTHVPLTAKRVLERFWESGETSWDACFDKPYAFTSQLAVDTSRLLPYD
ncbi:hypothetical protein CSOJ01_02579 [Colletotrichum sojae]|uniref:Zn(2)-C6 fungal-type domain-containing protein n=1 Tax=Colletotrichum sojae TaxID=2175907 RepID=A0A8H6N1Q9_9PEZI|nr:hypothetical protein CSOJ01_02579 [Colletotrichum sojae]